MQRAMLMPVEKKEIAEKYARRDKTLTSENIALVLGVKKEDVQADRSLVRVNFDNHKTALACLNNLTKSRDDLRIIGGYYLKATYQCDKNNHTNELSIGNKALDHFADIIQDELKKKSKKIIDNARNEVSSQCSSPSISASKNPLDDGSKEILEEENKRSQGPSLSSSPFSFYKSGIPRSNFLTEIYSLINELEIEKAGLKEKQDCIKHYLRKAPGLHIGRKTDKIAFLNQIIKHHNDYPNKTIKECLEAVIDNNPQGYEAAVKGRFKKRTYKLLNTILKEHNENKLIQTNSQHEKNIAYKR